MLSVLSVIILMITNNPYNIPERPAKQRKVNLETTPLFPHQLNRSQEPDIKHNHPTRNKQIPFFESTVTEVCRLPMSPQPSLKSHNLQTSNVTQWEGHPHNLFNSSYQSWPDLNQKIALLSRRLDSHEKALFQLMESRKCDSQTANLTDSSTFSLDNFSQTMSRQMERYQSTEQAVDKMRQEFNSYRSHSLKVGEALEIKLREQKEDITQELLSSFKQSLEDKFKQEESKISDFLTEFEESQKNQINSRMLEIQNEIRQYCQSLIEGSKEKETPQRKTILEEMAGVKTKLELLSSSMQDFQSSYRSFKEQMLDNVLATQDHKRWLYEIDHKIEEIRQNVSLSQDLRRGSISVSKEYCMKQKYHLRYEEYLSIAEKSSQISVKALERTYLVDEEGYLLDSHHFYIIDSNGNRIRLSELELETLQHSGLLK